MNLPIHLTRGGINNAAGEESPNNLAVETARLIISRHVSPRKHFNTKTTSYHLKHVCERLAGCYISNGDFIAAMILEGYEWKERKPGSPNAYFRANFKELRAIDKMINRSGVPVVDPDCVECLSAQSQNS